jgi:hypothetical protein
LGRDLKISDLKRSGFGIPYTNIDCLKGIMKFPDDDEKIVDYLQYAKSVLENNLGIINKEAKLKK